MRRRGPSGKSLDGAPMRRSTEARIRRAVLLRQGEDRALRAFKTGVRKG